ncbi:DUF2330 domain-containing protein [Mycobacterium sp. 1423905.2]|uniref:DUF2330 domain-containing protein n=1 Tax=Mycobacterium sp. 1423905.2 TaxID=1856859 RepID=UPI0007FDEBD0|nr:DUF2330 domain-containing protein [Mycobacterium sp. 1423905.2]OBJ61031.1 hypothetical protein A9W95_00545 [Mycobacterium sp. 1423905.2]
MSVIRVCRLAVVAVVLAGAVALSTPSYACACGAAITPPGGRASMNHEVALAHWDGATETVLMQLAMDAAGDNVALVVPTPTPATVAAGDGATFRELDALTAPEVRHERRWSLGWGAGSAPREGAVAASGPAVVGQVQLGPLEATTLAGGDLAGLQKWLTDNGYAIRPAVLQAMDPYVRDRWSFVAMRLTSTAPLAGGLSPVRLTFQSTALVYPMRLSIAAPGPQHVTVFTLCEHRQQRIDADARSQSTEIQFAGNIADAVRDSALRELVGNHGGYLTKTRVDIDQTSGITSDFAFGNAPNDDPQREVRIVADDVVIPVEALVLTAVVLAAIAATLVVLRRRRSRA